MGPHKFSNRTLITVEVLSLFCNVVASHSTVFRKKIGSYYFYSSFSGDMSDAIRDVDSRYNLNGMPFSTVESDNDNSSSDSCSYGNAAGWWFNDCAEACLTCDHPMWTAACNIESSRMIIIADETNQ